MDLRSGAVTQEFQKQKKTKKGRHKSTNKSVESMATESSLERNLKEMLTGFKDEISRQIRDLRQDFNTFSTEIKEMRGDINNICSEIETITQKRLASERTSFRD